MTRLEGFCPVTILRSMFCALIFSSPIWCGALLLSQDLLLPYIILNTLLAPLSILIFLQIPRNLSFGFFVGLILFYWVGLSFRFSPFPYAGIFASIAVAAIYAIIFWLLLWLTHPIYRSITLVFMGFIHPFYFDWLQIRAFFAYSFFGVDLLSFICVILACVCLCELYWQTKHRHYIFFRNFQHIKLPKPFLLVLIFLFFGIAIFRSHPTLHPIIPLPKIALVQTDIPQDLLWDSTVYANQENENMTLINQAKNLGYPAIIFPESNFPIALNKMPSTLKLLQDASKDISIVTGSVRQSLDEDQKPLFFNSTYIFQQGFFQIIDKVNLAPFGERIPLPNFLARPISKLFFGTDIHFTQNQEYGNFSLLGLNFRNAICYEGTSAALYEDHPKLIIMISNNAWFQPSTEPYFQQILLKYYARLNQSTLFHSANGSKSMLIIPTILNPHQYSVDILTPNAIPTQRMAQ